MEIETFIEVKRVSVFALKDSTALFLCCDNKAILVQTEAAFYEKAINAMQQKATPRPLTYELLANICRGFEAHLELIAINDFRDSVFYARMLFVMENELGRKALEIDARPSDAVLQALLVRAKIFIEPKVYEKAEDAMSLLKKLVAREAKNATQ